MHEDKDWVERHCYTQMRRREREEEESGPAVMDVLDWCSSGL